MKVGNKLNSIRNWGLPYVKPVVAWNQSFQRNILKVDSHLARICLDHLIVKIKNPEFWVRIICPVAKVSHSLSEPGAHVEVRMLRTLGLLICKAGLLLPVGNAVRISRLIFPAFPTGATESSVCTVTALAVSSVGIKFPFVPLLYFISTIESDISLPLGFRDFFFLCL